MLVQARDLAARIGMAGEARRLDARMSTVSRRGAVRAEPVLPDGLTAREAEVLCLIAAGMSNRGKADATVYALRHGLI